MNRHHGLDPRRLRGDGGGEEPGFHVGAEMAFGEEHDVEPGAVRGEQHVMRQHVGWVGHAVGQRRQGAPDGGVDLGRAHGDVRHGRVETELHAASPSRFLSPAYFCWPSM